MQEGWTLWDSSFTHTQEAGKALLVLWEAQAASGERAEVFCFHFSFPGDGMEGPSSVEMGALMQEKQPLQNWLPSFTGTWWGKKKKRKEKLTKVTQLVKARVYTQICQVPLSSLSTTWNHVQVLAYMHAHKYTHTTLVQDSVMSIIWTVEMP